MGKIGGTGESPVPVGGEGSRGVWGQRLGVGTGVETLRGTGRERGEESVGEWSGGWERKGERGSPEKADRGRRAGRGGGGGGWGVKQRGQQPGPRLSHVPHPSRIQTGSSPPRDRSSSLRPSLLPLQAPDPSHPRHPPLLHGQDLERGASTSPTRPCRAAQRGTLGPWTRPRGTPRTRAAAEGDLSLQKSPLDRYLVIEELARVYRHGFLIEESSV